MNASCARRVSLEHIAFKGNDSCHRSDSIDLLRPIGYANLHGLRVDSVIKMNPWSNRVFTGRVKSITTDKYKVIRNRRESRYAPVTGIFVHRVKNVKTWYFVDEKQHITTLNATDNHPFYIRNLHAFLPVKEITPEMLLYAGGRNLHLLCHGKPGHCGRPFHSGRAVYVYNVEVKKRHIYYVGKENVLVHNCAANIKVVSDIADTQLSMPDTEIKPQKKITFDVEAHEHEYTPDFLSNLEIVLKVSHRYEQGKLFTITIKNGTWHFYNPPEDLSQNWQRYYRSVVRDLKKINIKTEYNFFAAEIVEVDFGRYVSQSDFDDYFKTNACHFFQATLQAFGNVKSKMIPLRLRNTVAPFPFCACLAGLFYCLVGA